MKILSTTNSARKTSISPIPFKAMSASRISVAVALTGKIAVVSLSNVRVSPPPREASVSADALSASCCSGKLKFIGAVPACTTSVMDESTPVVPVTSIPIGGILPKFCGDVTKGP